MTELMSKRSFKLIQFQSICLVARSAGSVFLATPGSRLCSDGYCERTYMDKNPYHIVATNLFRTLHSQCIWLLGGAATGRLNKVTFQTVSMTKSFFSVHMSKFTFYPFITHMRTSYEKSCRETYEKSCRETDTPPPFWIRFCFKNNGIIIRTLLRTRTIVDT